MSGFEDMSDWVWESILYPKYAQSLPHMCKTTRGFSLPLLSCSCSIKLPLAYNWCDKEWSYSALCATIYKWLGILLCTWMLRVCLQLISKCLALRGLNAFHNRPPQIMVTDAQNPTVCSAVSFYYEHCIFHSDYAEHLYDFQRALLIWEQQHYRANRHVGERRAEIYPHSHSPPLGNIESKSSNAIVACCLELRGPAVLLFLNFFSSSIGLDQACKQGIVSYRKRLWLS